MNNNYRITVIGAGYVGLPLAVLLSQNQHVTVMDINETIVQTINNRVSPVKDDELSAFLVERELNLTATTDFERACSDADFVVLALPTDFDRVNGHLDCSHLVETVRKIDSLSLTPTIVIKSTVPVGFTESLEKQFPKQRIVFAPEFIRETRALYDNLYPSRIIIGARSEALDRARIFAELLADGAQKKEIDIVYVNESEAEAIKLLSNAYLAMRVSFFNEVDTFAENKGLSSKNIIKGISLDPRIGDFYNNPSFGYGGYCLPKDTKQLQSDFAGVPGDMIDAIVDSNDKRKLYIVDRISEKISSVDNNPCVGVYRAVMKKGSDNFRETPVNQIIGTLRSRGIEVIVYEPLLGDRKIFAECGVVNDLAEFKERSDLIIANRYNNEDLADVLSKVYTRDLFGEN